MIATAPALTADEDILARHRVTVRGNPAGRPLLFAHGFGCDQAMWRRVAPAFEDEFLVVAFDHAGSGAPDPDRPFRPEHYPTLHSYADDVLAICRALDLADVTLVGHSVSAMIGVLAAIAEPERFASLVLVAPSPRYLDDEGYRGGFDAEAIDGLLEAMAIDHLGWSATMAPMIAGNPDRPELGDELTASFCATDPAAARHFAALTFRADNRADLPQLRVPSLILQCREDVIAPLEVGDYLHAHLPQSALRVLDATGHCPQLTAPEETIGAIAAHVSA
jgi:sigma-B regulation protein RsbQ